MTLPDPMNAAVKPAPNPKRKPLRPPRKLRPKQECAPLLRALARHAPIRWTLCPHRLCRRRRCCVLWKHCINPRAPWLDQRPVFIERMIAKIERWQEEDRRLVKQREEERTQAPWRARTEAFECPNT